MFAEFHARSAFSFLRGSSPPEEMVRHAAELGYSALAITDHGGFYGSARAHQAAKDCGIRAIVGTTLDLPDGSHLKITTARYYTPNGNSVHREEGTKEWGVAPDVLSEMSQDEYAKLMKTWSDERVSKGERPAPPEGFRDFQLDAAIEVLKAKIDKRELKVEARVIKKEAKTQED